MDLSKFPFSKNRESDQLTPDLLKEKKDAPASEAKEYSPDRQAEKTPDSKFLDKKDSSQLESDKPHLKTPPQKDSSLPAKSVSLKHIENILQEDMEDIYFSMDEAHRRMFKSEGERVAIQIDRVIAAGKSTAVKVLELVKKWLQLIPGVNKFFIEQEAKIKTDKILKINETK